MNLLARLLCLIGWHDWSYVASDNFTRVFRRCEQCFKRQELQRDINPREYWK